MTIITKEEHGKIKKHDIRNFGIGMGFIIFGFIESIAVTALSPDLLPFSLPIFAACFCVGSGFLLNSTTASQCPQCKEYYKGEHTENECLCALKNKLENLK